MTTLASLRSLVSPLSVVAFNDHVRNENPAIENPFKECGGTFKIVRKSDGVTIAESSTKGFAARWACYVSNATNPKMPFSERGSVEKVLCDNGAITTPEGVNEKYEMRITGWEHSSAFPTRKPNGSKAEAPKVLDMLGTLKLAQAKLDADLVNLRDQETLIQQAIQAKEKEIRRGQKLLDAFESDDDSDDDLLEPT